MAKKNGSSSSRRFTHKSFRERVDSIKIDPILNLHKKSFHEVEISHFLSTLEHWKEVNLSKTFSELVEQVEPLTLSLPQLLYHQEKIFDFLEASLKLNDDLSLQPSLELLSQFAHDLGPDFIPYYSRSLLVIRDLSTQEQANSEALEWIFNCLAYIFKYLSKELSKDLIPTFELLLPLLSLRTKDYVTRFASQAISFLVRKANAKSLSAFIEKVFNAKELIEDNLESYHKALTIIFADSLKSTSGNLHSKSATILTYLTNQCILIPKSEAVLSDVIMDVLSYTESKTEAVVLYDTLTKLIDQHLEDEGMNLTKLTNLTKLLATLAFAESGWKVTSWTKLLSYVKTLCELSSTLMVEDDDDELMKANFGDSIVQFASVLIRNSDLQELTKKHIDLFTSMSKVNDKSVFLPFIDNASDLNKERVLMFGNKYVRSFVSENWETSYKSIAYFLTKLNDKNMITVSDDAQASNQAILINITDEFSKFIISKFEKSVDFENSNELLDCYWRMIILEYTTSVNVPIRYLLKFFKAIQSRSSSVDKFSIDLTGSILGAISNQPLNDETTLEVLKIVLLNSTRCLESTVFLESFDKFVIKIESTHTKTLDLLSKNKDLIIDQAAENLLTPSHKSRELSLNLIISLHNTLRLECSETINTCRLIEQIPLELQVGRDIQLRFRNMISIFNGEVTSELVNKVVVNFLFGQLSNKFQPSWLAVFEFTQAVITKFSELVWKNAFEMISIKYETLQDDVYFEHNFDSFNATTDMNNWLPQNTRLLTNYEINEKTCHTYQQIDLSLIEYSETKRDSLKLTSFNRGQSIKLLSKVPEVAERHFEFILPYILDESGNLDDDSSILKEWTATDRNSLIELLTKFKKLNKVARVDDLKEFLLILLSNNSSNTQDLALRCLLNMKNPVYNKYQDNLKNLLDNTMFRDEVIKFLQNKEESTIEDKDLNVLMPLVLRILYGRSQTKGTGNKQSTRLASIKILANFPDEYIKDFLALSFKKIPFDQLFQDGGDIDKDIKYRLLRNISGFLNLNLETVDILRRAHFDCLTVLIKPLIYSLCVSEYVISNPSNFQEEKFNKIARNNRQSGFKLLFSITQYLGANFDWKPFGDIIYFHLIESKMENFAEENLQGPSSLTKLMSSLWPDKNLHFFLYYNDNQPVKSLLSILPNPKAKDTILLNVLDFIIALLENSSDDDEFVSVIALIISSCLDSLVHVFENTTNSEVNAKAVQILLTFVEREFITENESRKILVSSLTAALEKPNGQLHVKVKADVVRIIAGIVKDYDCSLNEIRPLYENMSKLYMVYSERDMRIVISSVFLSLAERFEEFARIAPIVDDLNSYSKKRIHDGDFERRLSAFSLVNREIYLNLSLLEWLPVVYTALYFINDENDQSMRTSASYSLIRYIDCVSSKDSEEEASEYVEFLEKTVLDTVRLGLRKKHEMVQIEYISVISHIVESCKYYHGLDDMKVLLHNGDEEANFFKNINHPQVHRRQRAIRRLVEYGSELSGMTIARYLLPIIERYAFWTEDKFRNIANETIITISKLMCYVSWNQFRAIYVRYIQMMKTAKLKEREEQLRDSVLLVVALSTSLNQWATSSDSRPKDFPKTAEKLDKIILEDIIPPLRKMLSVRDEKTVLYRVPLSEALTSLVMCCSNDKISSELPGILTSICHILRARSEELRDTVRKHLCRIAIFLGPDYFKFILKELKTALQRGPQLHILSFTVHTLLLALQDHFQHGDLGDTANILIQVIMNDIFGEGSQEKEAEGYNNKMKEIKHNKSYDTGELVAGNIFLKDFGHLISPVKYLLQERLSLKTQRKLDELLRRFSLGLNKNEEASSTDIIVLCHEIHSQAIDFVNDNIKEDREKEIDEKDEHFLVQLDARPVKTQLEYSLYIKTMQKFSFELLRTAITKHASLFTVSNLSDFVPILETSLSSDDEGVVISALKVLTLLVRLDFPDEINGKFTASARSVLKIVKDMPSTNNELCQTCLKFLSATIRHKEDLRLKDTAISYILKKVEPDLDEPMRQGVAFGFVKSLISKHFMISEIYDTMAIVSRIMVTSTSKEIREVSRSVFFTFLMEYDQSRGRLEKQFKILINNLEYPAQSGRQSVMELIHLIVNKAGKELLEKLASSFFIALANVSISDDSPTCREMASESIRLILSKLSDSDGNLEFVDKYISLWLKQNRNELLARCGLHVYSIYVSSVGFDSNVSLNEIALDRITSTLLSAKKSEDVLSSLSDVSHELVYFSLTTLEKLIDETDLFDSKYEKIWNYIVDSLLYPHSWVRLSSSRLVGSLLKTFVDNNDELGFEIPDSQLQEIAYRLFRQLGAPNISEKLSNQVATNLVYISKKWNSDETPFVQYQTEEQRQESDSSAPRFSSAFDWAINRCSAILKNESRPNKDMIVTKKSIIRYVAFLTSFLETPKLSEIVSSQLLVPLINISEQEPLIEDDENEENTLPFLASRCMEKISSKLGVSDYNLIYSNAKKIMTERRHDRKTKRAQLSLKNPEVAAQRKLKKHMRSREKRKSEKDENGFYKPKKKRRV